MARTEESSHRSGSGKSASPSLTRRERTRTLVAPNAGNGGLRRARRCRKRRSFSRDFGVPAPQDLRVSGTGIAPEMPEEPPGRMSTDPIKGPIGDLARYSGLGL